MAAVTVAAASASTSKTRAATSGTVGLGFGLVDRQGSSAQISPIECRDRRIGFTGIGHFNKAETSGAARVPIGHERDLFHRAMCLEDISQHRFGCAVGQILNVKVLHRNSSLTRSSKLVGVAVGFDGRPSESRGGADGGDSPRSFQDAPSLSQISTIGGKSVIHASHASRDLVFGVLHRRLLIHVGRIRKIFWLADQERQPLSGSGTTNLITKSVAMTLSFFHIDQDEVIQLGFPPCAGFRDVRGAIYIHAELPHNVSTQLALRLRSVNEQHSLLLVCAGSWRGER